MRRETNLWRDVIHRQFLVNVASSPLCAANLLGLVRVCFWLFRQFCSWLCRKVLLLAVSPGLFQALSPCVVLVVACGPGYPGYVIKDKVIRTSSDYLDQGIVQEENSPTVECNCGPYIYYTNNILEYSVEEQV